MKSNVKLLVHYRGIFSYTVRRHFSDDVGEALSTASNVTKVRIRKEPTSDERKKVMINWHKTNQQLFGPVVQEKKQRKKTDPKKNEHRDIKSSKITNGALIPINLWQTVDPASFRTRKLGKENRESTCNKNNNAIDAKSIVGVSSDVNQMNIAPCPEPLLKSKEAVATPIKSANHLPETPFYAQDGILFPFPLTINKSNASSPSSEIYSLRSQKLAFPSVTEILSKTRSDASELALAVWRKKKIAEVGEEGLEEFMQGFYLV